MSKAKKITITRGTVLDGKKFKRGDVVTTNDTYLLRTGAAVEGDVKLKKEKNDAEDKTK